MNDAQRMRLMLLTLRRGGSPDRSRRPPPSPSVSGAVQGRSRAFAPAGPSADAQELVAEVCHEAEAPAESLDVAVAHVAGGDPAPLHLSDPALPPPQPAPGL